MNFNQYHGAGAATIAALATTLAFGAIGQERDWFLGESEIDTESGFQIPLKQTEYRKETREQRKAWQRVLKQCGPASNHASLEPECMSALSDYFLDEPVWEYGRLLYYDKEGLQRAIPLPLDTRDDNLAFGYDDYALEEIPLWSDIFDGELDKRSRVFSRTARDLPCVELRFKGIQEHMAERCFARELYKYGTYLQACSHAMDRLNLLNNPSFSSISDRLSVYETSKKIIQEQIQDLELRELAQARTVKGYWHASWVTHTCSSQSFVLLPVDDDLPNQFDENGDQSSLFEDRWSRAQHYSIAVALEIASRSGDEWAIRSVPMSSSTQPEYMMDVLEKYPLLAHKHFGFSPLFRSELGYGGQQLHRAKAYLLLEAEAGSKVAKTEFDYRSLRNQIDDLRKGGQLKMPSAVIYLRNLNNIKANTFEIHESLR